MENYVSFDMAKRLKEAGFPQPTRLECQHWYESVFAPTAQDIQKEFQKRFGGCLESSYNETVDVWHCGDSTESLVGDNGYAISAKDKNPADAAARCFLSNPRKRGS